MPARRPPLWLTVLAAISFAAALALVTLMLAVRRAPPDEGEIAFGADEWLLTSAGLMHAQRDPWPRTDVTPDAANRGLRGEWTGEFVVEIKHTGTYEFVPEYRKPPPPFVGTVTVVTRITMLPFRPWLKVAAVAPILWVVVLLHRRRAARRYLDGRWWLCQQCGYDLRATPYGCPECGRPNVPPPQVRGRAPAAPGRSSAR